MLEADLAGLVPSGRARDTYLRLDDDRLAAAIARLRRDEARLRRDGHIASTGFGLHKVSEQDRSGA
ncbi:MAG: hypothetical protein ABIF45_17435 [Pseudomonadota bacterium]